MSTMFSSNSSGGVLVPPRRAAAIPNILPRPPACAGQRRAEAKANAKANAGTAYVAENPPSTYSVCPVTYALAGEARNTAVPAKSAGSLLRPTMVRAAIAAIRAGSLATAALSLVGTKPGHTELQHTPDAAQASDCDRVSAARPPLDAPYPPLFRNARWACCEVTLIIRPQPRAAINGPNRWPSRNGAVRLTAMVRSQSAMLSSASGGRTLTPAQLTRMSADPNAATAAAAARSSPARSA